MNYHDHPALSASKLKKFISGTPRDFWYAYEWPDRMPVMPTEAMRQGSLLDCMITEPERFDSKYAVAPVCDRRTKAGKELWDKCFKAAASKGAELVNKPMYDTAEAIKQSLCSDPLVHEYLQGSGQVPHYWHDEVHDTEMRYLPDIEDPEEGLLVDLKKARSADPRHFKSQSYNLCYDIQVAHYAEGYRDKYGEYPRKIVLLAYEWNFPYNTSINVISDSLLELGRQRRDRAIEGIKECRGTNEWPSWGVHTMEAPTWAHIDDPASDTDVADLLEGV